MDNQLSNPDEIRSWLEEMDLFNRELDPDEVQVDEINFAYEVTIGGFNHFVLQVKGEEVFTIQSPIEIDDPHYELLHEKLSQPKKQEFIWDLQMELLWKDVDFEFYPDRESVEEVIFVSWLQGPVLSKEEFGERLQQIHKCNLFIAWSFQRLESIYAGDEASP